MSHSEAIDLEIRNLIIRLRSKTVADFEVPCVVYAQIMHDNDLRKKPYRVSYERIGNTLKQMRSAGMIV